MDNETVRVQLSFPLEQVTKPIIWHISHDFGLVFSIRRASVDIKSGGFTSLELTGPRPQIDKALDWARSEGVEVSGVAIDGGEGWADR